MDFSYFTSAPQPYHFFNLPPTPTASSTPQPGEYKMGLGQEQFDSAFANFQQSFHLDPTTFLTQPNNMLPPPSPPKPLRSDSTASIPDMTGTELGFQDSTLDGPDRARSSSEEKDTMTPAQSRRKAQNRAAQRAFRERKERHVKDLEAKLTTLQHHSASLNGENERLKRELAKVATENEILRATSGSNPFVDDLEDITSGPLRYSPTDYYPRPSGGDSTDSSLNDASTGYSTTVANTQRRSSVARRVLDDETGEPLLAAGATWDYIQASELFRRGLVDVGDVCERLKKMARCDGQGPVFQESDVRRAIAESAVAGGRDELI